MFFFFLITSAKEEKNQATFYEPEMSFQRVQIVLLWLKQNFRVQENGAVNSEEAPAKPEIS